MAQGGGPGEARRQGGQCEGWGGGGGGSKEWCDYLGLPHHAISPNCHRATPSPPLKLPGERLLPHEAVFKLHPAELPLRSLELSTDKAGAAHDLGVCLADLRYHLTLQARTRRHTAAAGAAAAPATAAATATAASTSDPPQHVGAGSGGAAGRAGDVAPASGSGSCMGDAPASSVLVRSGSGSGPEAVKDPEAVADMCPICHETLGEH